MIMILKRHIGKGLKFIMARQQSAQYCRSTSIKTFWPVHMYKKKPCQD